MLSRDLNALEASQREAARVARGILEGRQGICEGCRALKALAYDVVPDWVADPDFVVVGALDSGSWIGSRSDMFVTDGIRRHWPHSISSAKEVERRTSRTCLRPVAPSWRALVLANPALQSDGRVGRYAPSRVRR